MGIEHLIQKKTITLGVARLAGPSMSKPNQVDVKQGGTRCMLKPNAARIKDAYDKKRRSREKGG